MPDPRQTIIEAAAARDIPLTYLSRMIGRNTTWLHQYVAEQSPRVLPEFERRLLAMALDVDERSLGARDPWSPIARPL